MKNNLWILVILVILYFLLKYFIPYGNYVLYPVNLLVTFLHEFGHAFFALVTGGSVKWIQINSDGSWYTITAGGIRNLVLMWGYIWSAIFWNILLYIWFKKPKLAENIIYFLAWLLVFVAIFWFNSLFSSLILILLAFVLFFLAKKTKYDAVVLQALGLFSILYIIEDFNVWPSSDLASFSTIIPSWIWMWIWLMIVILITWYNLKLIFKK